MLPTLNIFVKIFFINIILPRKPQNCSHWSKFVAAAVTPHGRYIAKVALPEVAFLLHFIENNDMMLNRHQRTQMACANFHMCESVCQQFQNGWHFANFMLLLGKEVAQIVDSTSLVHVVLYVLTSGFNKIFVIFAWSFIFHLVLLTP